MLAGAVSNHPFKNINVSREKSSLTDIIPLFLPYLIVWVFISASFEYLEDIEVPTLRRMFQSTTPGDIAKSRLVHAPFKDVCLPEVSCSPVVARHYCEFIAWSMFSTNSKLQHIQVAALDDGFSQNTRERNLPKYFVLQSPLEALDGSDEIRHFEGPWLSVRITHRVPEVLVDQPEHATVGGVEPGEHLLFEQVACESQTIQGVLRGVPRHLHSISRLDSATLILRRHLDAIRADGGFGGRASRVSWYCEKAPSKRPSKVVVEFA